MSIIRFIFRNLGYLYKRYRVSFYFESYLCMIVGLWVFVTLTGDMILDIKEIIIFNIITYPFTRFFYYSCKESLIGNITWDGIILKYIFKFLAFMFIWTFSFLPGTCCMIYILINENAKEYNKRKIDIDIDVF